MLLCASCHFFAHRNPVLFAEFVRGYLGDIKYENLKQHAASIKKWTLDEMIEYYEKLQNHKELKSEFFGE